MSKPRLIPLFRTGYSSTVPTFDSNGEYNVEKYSRVIVDVPQGEGPASEDISLADYVAAYDAGTLVEGTVYSIIIPG